MSNLYICFREFKIRLHYCFNESFAASEETKKKKEKKKRKPNVIAAVTLSKRKIVKTILNSFEREENLQHNYILNFVFR